MGSRKPPFFSRNITSEVSVLSVLYPESTQPSDPVSVHPSGNSLPGEAVLHSARRVQRLQGPQPNFSHVPHSSRHGMAWQLFDIAECV